MLLGCWDTENQWKHGCKSDQQDPGLKLEVSPLLCGWTSHLKTSVNLPPDLWQDWVNMLQYSMVQTTSIVFTKWLLLYRRSGYSFSANRYPYVEEIDPQYCNPILFVWCPELYVQ